MKRNAYTSSVHSTALPSGTIDLWRIALARVAAGRLPADDEAAAGRFQHAEAAESWRASRLALRQVLARYCGIAPHEVPLQRGRWGKPFLPGGPSFNLTTDGSEVVIVVRRVGEVGVDLQTAAVFPADLQLVADQALDPVDTTASRARWARLEAVVKCCGQGFMVPVPAALIAALATTHGEVRIGPCVAWWGDQQHLSGALCIAADTPWEQIVACSLPA